MDKNKKAALMKDGLTAAVSSTGIIRIRFNGRTLYDLIGPSQPGTSELPTQPTFYVRLFSNSNCSPICQEI